ncbi:phage tail tape measure protein [Anaerosolibacter sp.]|uniref:phage tail tape measure protein n=1 Tax=Anaerosolibacter sp. TaxID=1872527 RepID=UPI0039F13445
MAETIKGINVLIGSDTTGLSKALGDVNKQSKDIQSELKQVERLLKMDPSNTELLAQKQKLLGDAVETTKEKLNRLKDAQSQVNDQFSRGEISEGQYRAFQRELAKTEQELEKFEDQLKKSNPALEAFGHKAKEAGEKMSTIGGNLTKYVTAPLIAAGAGLVAAGSQFDDAFDKIRVGTGATGDALEALNEDFRKVAADVPASFDDISTAIADYNTRLGVTGDGLQDLSKQTLELVRITGGDLSKTIEETSQSFQAFNVPATEYGKSLDFIFKVSQSTGIGIDRLQQNLVKFAPALKQLGLDFEQSATLMGQLDKAGVDVEQTLAGLTKAVATMAKDGITNANEAVKILFDEIKNAPSDLQGTEAAMETFGAKAGPALASAIREGKLEYQDLLKTLQGSDETILGVADETKDWAEGLLELKNNLLLAVEPISGQLFGALNDVIPLLKSVLTFIAGLIQRFADLPAGIQSAVLVILGLIAALGPVISLVGTLTTAAGAMSISIGALAAPIAIAIAAIAALVAIGVTLYKNWDTIKAYASQLASSIRQKFDEIKASISNAWNNAVQNTRQAISNISSVVTSTLSNLASSMRSIGSDIVRGLWNGISSMASWIKDKISDFVGGITKSVKNVLGIHSPSRVFAGIGENMAEGLGVGFGGEINRVKNEIANAMPTSMFEVAPNISGNIQGLQDPGLSGGDIIIENMIVRNDNDIKLIARELFNLKQSAGRGKGVVTV